MLSCAKKRSDGAKHASAGRGERMISERVRRAFLERVAPYLDDGYSLAKWLSGRSEDAEDIVQEASIRALAALERAEVSNARAWWLSIVRNAALTYMARRRPGALAFVGDLADLETFESASSADAPPSAEQRMIEAETGERVRRAIAGLPSPLRETLVMREINGLAYRDIAEATEAPIGTVMSRLARARAAIARELEGLR